MPRAGEMWAVIESPLSTTSTGIADVKTIAPTVRRPNGVWVSVETTNARMTFDGTTPGTGTGPGLVIVAGAPAQFFPFAANRLAWPGPQIKFCSALAGSSVVTPMFVE